MAMQLMGEDLRRRLGALTVLVMAVNATAFVFQLQLSALRGDTAEVQLQTTGNCTYPIAVRWSRAKRSSTGLTSIGSKAALLDYLVRQLRR